MNDSEKKVGQDLVDKLLGGFDHVLDLFHDRVLRPIIVAARVIAYGLVIALAAVILFAALIIGFVRLLNVYAFAGHEWLSYAVIGALSLIVGLLLWRRRRPVPAGN
jgi:hypothetical protein